MQPSGGGFSGAAKLPVRRGSPTPVSLPLLHRPETFSKSVPVEVDDARPEKLPLKFSTRLTNASF
jgi:hypothetical protein